MDHRLNHQLRDPGTALDIEPRLAVVSENDSEFSSIALVNLPGLFSTMTPYSAARPLRERI